MLKGTPQPLSGLRVLDLTTVIYGPYTTQLLGDFGADVIKIEPPGGDMTRDIGVGRNLKMTALFMGANRNKRSIVLDLKREEARGALWRLIDGADVFVHNIRPQKLAKLGFDPDKVLIRNKKIVYGALLGYREDGPYGGMPAYDDVIQGQSGLAGTFAARDGEPVLMPTIVADKTAGLLASNGLLAALIKRLVTGMGVYVETSMFEGLAAYTLLEHQDGTIFQPPLKGPGYPRALSPERRPHRTADGYLCMLAYTDQHWHRFWALSGQEEGPAVDARFETMSSRADNIDALYKIAGDILKRRTTAEWLQALREAEIPAGPVNRLEDLRDDAHLQAIGFFRPFQHPSEGAIEIPDTAYRFDHATLPVHRPQPRLGEHTEEVLREAGLSAKEDAAVMSEGSEKENMKAIRLEGNWGLDNLHEVELPDPKPGPDEILIKMEAVSINPRDKILIEGGYGRMAGSLPLIPLCDGAGRVAELGANVTHVAAGDLVCPAYSRTWLHGTSGAHTHDGAHGGMIDGTMCELMVVPAEVVVKAPDHLDAYEAASLPCAAVTAWNAVVEEGEVTAGDTVLLQGTGGVSLFALQFAKMAGARTILISSSDEKLERARALGADHLINYRSEPDWQKRTREITEGRGVDHIVDIGGAGTLDRAIAAVRPSGRISLIGVLGGGVSALQLGRVVTRHVRLQGVTVGSCQMFQRMALAMSLHRTRPVLDEGRFAFGGLREALERLPKGEHVGKIVGTI